jgi:TolB-like protein/tetratricopeptide (TPR) repeat protein
MSYRVGEYELDPVKFELRRSGTSVAVEPQVFALLVLFMENRDRLITKDEIVDHVWNGRIVSDAAVTSRIKSARQALGDDGHEQRVIRTVHGRGYRFVAEVRREAPVAAQEARAKPTAVPDTRTGKPSIAVLPFTMIGADPYASLVADAFPHEIIAELSRLRWLFVIARGSSFRLRDATLDIRQVGAMLGVRYCLCGSVSANRQRMEIGVELADTQDGGVIWAEHYAAATESIHEVRARIVAAVSTTIELQIPLREAQNARLRSPDDLDTWSAYHLGLQHGYRFNARDNAIALALFERAVAKEPEFARAHAGLSFAQFQNAFLGYVPDAKGAAVVARRSAERALEIDALDPFANFTFGRSLWLEDNVSNSLIWLDRSVTLSPNYAQGHYAKAWADTLLGNGAEGQARTEAAIALSPIDPMLYAMLATRALTHLVREDYAAAARWADEAVRSPGAHAWILLIAAACHALDGDDEGARALALAARGRDPKISAARFFQAFPFADCEVRNRIGAALSRLGV